jgi:hypothetical protein
LDEIVACLCREKEGNSVVFDGFFEKTFRQQVFLGYSQVAFIEAYFDGLRFS